MRVLRISNSLNDARFLSKDLMRSYETSLSSSSSNGATLWGHNFCEHNASLMLDHLYKMNTTQPKYCSLCKHEPTIGLNCSFNDKL